MFFIINFAKLLKKALLAATVASVASLGFVSVAHADYWATTTLTTSGTFTVPAGVSQLSAILVGAGGGGAGGAFTYGGGGGGAGALATGTLSVTPNQVIPFVVGVGGVGGTAGNFGVNGGNGGNGSATVFNIFTANGGFGGQGANFSTTGGFGGAGGNALAQSGSNGDNFVGQRARGGNGGVTTIGVAGVGSFGNASTYIAPTAGTNGAGGGAGSGWTYQAGVYGDAGANGGNGQIVLTYYVDETAPVITIFGNNPETVELGSTYVDLGATALDNIDGDITANIVVTNTVNTAATGTYTVTYTVTDAGGNIASSTRIVNVVDTTAPVITILGANPLSVFASTTGVYTDLGATAFDLADGDITANIIVTNNVVMTVVGTYDVLYTVTDSSGNTAYATRTVNVLDTDFPTITILGNNPDTVIASTTGVYTDLGATAIDLIDGDLTAFITASGTVDLTTIGTYAIDYSVSDFSGNTATATRIVNVVSGADITAPVITILGANPLTEILSATSTYTDLGATAMDNIDGDVTASIVATNNVNLAATGTYSVVYSVTDLAGNTGYATRTVDVIAPTTPVVTTIDIAPVTPFVLIGGTAQFTATTTDQYGFVIVAGTNIFVSSNNAVGTINPFTGLFNGLANGTTTVTVFNGSVSTSTVVTVSNVPPMLTTLTIAPLNPTYVIGATSTFTATTLDQYGNPFATTTTWSSSDTAVATIDSITGALDALTTGTTTITATAGSLTATTTVTVTPVVIVDTTAPTTPVITGVSATGTIITTATLTWTDSVDTESGLAGYLYVFDNSASTVVSTTTSGVQSTTGTTTTQITLGTQWFHVAAIDNAGNISGTVTRGPLVISDSQVLYVNSTIGGNFYTLFSPSLAQATLASTTGTTTITNSTLATYWDVRDASVTNTSIDDANVFESSVSNSQLINAHVERCTVINSLVKNYFAQDCYVAFSTIDPATMYAFVRSTTTNSQIYASNIYDSVIANNSYVATSTVNNSNIDASNVYTSTIGTSTIANGSTITDSVVTFSTLDNTDTTNATITQSVLTDTTVTDSTVTNATTTNSTITNGSSVTNATLTDTTLASSTVASSTLTNVVATNSTITNTTLANATTTNAVIDNDIIYSGTIEIGGVVYGPIMTPTPIASLGAADTTAPVITITGANPLTVLASSTGSYFDLGATAIDNVDPSVTVVTVSNTVNIATVGSYAVVYSATDVAGNTSYATRTVNVVATPDTTAPVITILGNNPETVTLGGTYTEAGATALDNVDGDITANIISTSTVDTNTLGSYTVTYSVTDGAGNTGYATRTVNVVNIPDTTAPVITVLGANPVTVLVGATYVDAGATATDNVDGNITGNIIMTNPVSSTTPAGSYTVIYTVSDAAGNGATSTRTVNVVATPDTTAPVITVLGNNPETVLVGATYTDLGATALDNVDGDITANIVTTGIVDTNTIGAYTITYAVVDGAGNGATSTRTVNVIAAPADTIAPVISITGGTPTSIFIGATYNDQGATYTDNVDGGPFAATVVSNNVDTNTLGSYDVVYSATDVAGNTSYATRTVNVIATTSDVTAPTITITGGTPTTIIVGSTYTDQGATAIDDVDGPIPATIFSTDVDENTIGSYSVVYVATDSSLNTSYATRTVNVVAASSSDVIPPVITVIGGTPVTVTQGSTYTDQGATALDDTDGDVTGNIVVTGSVDISIIGVYTITYTVADAAGNVATTDRTVNVIAAPADTIAPVITITGGTPITVSASSTYNDQGATYTDNVDGGPFAATVVSNNVDTNTLGSYDVVYSATDVAGNTSYATRTVNVVAADTQAPVITILGANPMTIALGGTYTEAGAMAIDNFDGDISSSIVITGSVNTAATGTYAIVYTSTDLAGNSASSTRIVDVVADTVAPVITITGANPASVTVGSAYADQGAVAVDAVDGTVAVMTVSNTVNINVIGSYAVVYSATDISGNTGYATRTVNVIATSSVVLGGGGAVVPTDVIAPVITINGTNPITVQLGSTYVDQGATALDETNGTVPVSVVDTVNTALAGTYTVTYTARDAAFNTATAVRTVTVVAPVVVATTTPTTPATSTVPGVGTNGNTGTVIPTGQSSSSVAINPDGSITLPNGLGTISPVDTNATETATTTDTEETEAGLFATALLGAANLPTLVKIIIIMILALGLGWAGYWFYKAKETVA